MNDTIFALATAPGRGAVAVVRVSGPGARNAMNLVGVGRLRPRWAGLRTLRGPGNQIIDQAIVLWFPRPHSFTGEDCVEFHLHGGRAVIDALTETLLTGAARLAEPGEFTRRAYENGKLDLSQAEATADLVDAETAAQARQAIGQLQGAIGRRYAGWRQRLVDVIACLEAALDFPDEDLPADLLNEVGAGLSGMIAELGDALSDAKRGLRVREGYRIALIGAPNAGKSTLANGLAGRDLAIVSELAGTTRDVIEITIDLGGNNVVIADTAGLHDAVHDIEKEGVRRASDWAARADLRIWVVDRAGKDGAWRAAERLVRPADICLLNKTDLTEGEDGRAARGAAGLLGLEVVELSKPRSVLDLKEILVARVRRDLEGSEFPAATRARHFKLLEVAGARLRAALAHLDDIDLAAEDIRLSVRALERVTGHIGAEDILDEVFKRFCIGK